MANAAGRPPHLRALKVLKALWANPSQLMPERTTEDITRGAARLFEKIASDLQGYAQSKPDYDRDREDARIAHFVSQMVFCMFASDIGLLPRGAFSRLLEGYARDRVRFRERLAALFRQMKTGGDYGADIIPWINGDLFTDDDVPEDLTTDAILLLQQLDGLNWADVEPAIFGTLFERVLDQRSRAKLGAHYTSRADIETLVEPVLMAPLRREWEATRKAAEDAQEQAKLRGATEETQRERVRWQIAPFLDRLAGVTVLDPACGSGNFLYVSLALLKGLEKEALAYGGLQGVRFEPRVHPRQLLGIEINPYAHELASMVIWIGYLQWKHRNAIPLDDEEPVLQRLDQISLMDAIVDRERKAETTYDRSSTIHHPPSTIHHPPSTIHHPPSTIHHPPSTIHHPPSTIHHPPSTIHHPPSTIHHPPSTIHHPPSTIHRGSRSGPPPMSSSATRPSSALAQGRCARNSGMSTLMICTRSGKAVWHTQQISVVTGTRRRASWCRMGK